MCSGRVSDKIIGQKRPYLVKESRTFILHQKITGIFYPFDLDSDDNGLLMNKSENARFYEINNFEKDTLKLSHEVSAIKDINGIIVGGTYNERNRKSWEIVRDSISKIYVVIRRRNSYVDENGSLTRYVTFIMTIKECNGPRDCIKDWQTFVLNYPTTIVNYSVIGDISLPADLCNRTTQHSTRKFIRNIIEKNPLEKPRIIQDQFVNKTSILDRETDSDFPRNLKQITNIKSSICNTLKNEDEIASHIAYLLEQPNEAIKSGPSSNDQSFLQEILLRKGRQPTYILFTEQSLKDIQRYCTNGSAPTSFRSILAIYTTFNVGSHYITQTTVEILVYYAMGSWSSSCLPLSREGRFCIYVAGSQERKEGIRKYCADWKRRVS